jgi:purine nucleosidase/pyrimidine-specific ribonucleoside hydrolase
MAIPILIDTDPGVDDFLALLLALRSPELRVEMLTTVGGNCPLRLATRNALRALEYEGRPDVHVYAGAARPDNGSFRYAPYFHGPSGLTARMPVPKRRASGRHAAHEMARVLEMHSQGAATLVALGPLTNIARLVKEHPQVAERAGRLVAMGGAVDCPGNVTSHAEFNVWNDPEAAETVLRSGLPVRLITLDVCNLVRLRPADVTGAEPLLRRMLENWSARRAPGDRFSMCDPLTVAAAFRPDLFMFKRLPISVTTSGAQRGRTTRGSSGPQVEVAVSVDVGGAFALFKQRLLSARPKRRLPRPGAPP